MSEVLYRLIPTNPDLAVPPKTASAAAQFLKIRLHAEEASYVVTERPVFVDCGSSLEHMFCPYCQKELSHAWWLKQMDVCADTEFQQRTVQFPCCNQQGQIEDIDYRAPCGIARTVLEVRGVRHIPSSDVIDTVRFLLQCNIRLIIARY